jgi:hypothetical protein
MFMVRRVLGIWLVLLAGVATLWATTPGEIKAFKAAALSFKTEAWERIDRELE